jgi:hypothetical protein
MLTSHISKHIFLKERRLFMLPETLHSASDIERAVIGAFMPERYFHNPSTGFLPRYKLRYNKYKEL